MSDKDLIEEARRLENDYGDAYEVMSHMSALADALEAATSERDAERDAQAERVSMEVLDEYRRIAAWLESQAALRGATGDTMHGLAAEALATLIDHEHSRHTIPLYGMLDVWMALYGISHPEFDEFYDEHGYAETWAQLLAEIRSRAAVPDAATERFEKAEHDRLYWRRRYQSMHKRAKGAEARLESVRELHVEVECDAGCLYGVGETPEWGTTNHCTVCTDVPWPCPTIAALDGAPEPEWEYGVEVEGEVAVRPKAIAERACASAEYATLVRRRKAGPWEACNE